MRQTEEAKKIIGRKLLCISELLLTNKISDEDARTLVRMLNSIEYNLGNATVYNRLYEYLRQLTQLHYDDEIKKKLAFTEDEINLLVRNT